MEEIRKVRLEKLKKLRDLGVDPFPQPSIPDRQDIEQVIRQSELARAVSLVGRLRAWRSHGGSTFADLEDGSGQVQIFFSRELLGDERYDFLSTFDIGDFLHVQGVTFKTEAGELTVKVSQFQLLTKSIHSLPSSFYGLKDVEERYRQRYVDLIINKGVRKVFETRTKVVRQLRRLLDEAGFMEVETPILQPIYGGATAQPFTTHHNSLDTNLYLRISDELYLKRLVVGGLEKVYEIGKDFRNEGLDRQHNPEFTMCEFYWAYSNYEELMSFSEELIAQIVKSVASSYKVNYEGQEIDFKPPWPRLSFRQVLIEACGLDIAQAQTEDSVLKFIKEEKLAVDLEGVLGYAAVLDALYKRVSRPGLRGPLFLVDHPCQMKPLAKRKANEPDKAASFQLVVCGLELINAYNELNDPLDQRARWEEEINLASRGLTEHQVLDEDYLRALEYGMPPTAGWGLGIDRLVSLLSNAHSIKDVILFPTLRPERQTASVSGSGTRRVMAEKPHGDGLPIEPAGDYLSRERVLGLVKGNIKNQNLFRHMLAVESAMKALARRLGGNEELWGNLGLLHDADWEETKADPSSHTQVTLGWLESQGHKAGPLVQALKSHNRKHTQLGELASIMEWSLECCDELTGFIVSVALVRPEKKLSAVEVEHVLKKWKEKSFAAAVDRSQIAQCEEKLGIPLNDFIGLILAAMKTIAPDLGL